jgi:hypothetical protein
MARDYENAINLDQLEDGDIRELVRQHLEEDDDFDADSVDIDVSDGRVTVEGRVGTEAERQHVEQVLTALGASRYSNDVVVDETYRAQRSEAADEARAEDAAAAAPMGEAGERTTDTAQHLQDDEAGDLYGTRDMQKAIQEGQTYVPPDGPTQEGIEGDERH